MYIFLFYLSIFFAFLLWHNVLYSAAYTISLPWFFLISFVFFFSVFPQVDLSSCFYVRRDIRNPHFAVITALTSRDFIWF